MSKTKALKAAAVCQHRLNAAEQTATAAALARDEALAAARAKGATYADLQGATGLSVARVTQVLRKVRQRLSEATAD